LYSLMPAVNVSKVTLLRQHELQSCKHHRITPSAPCKLSHNPHFYLIKQQGLCLFAIATLQMEPRH